MEELIRNNWLGNDMFTNGFTQRFIEYNGKFNHKEFIRFLDAPYSYQQVNSVLKQYTDKVFGFTYYEVENPEELEIFKQEYVFGRYQNMRDWLAHYNISRKELMQFIASQHPPKALSSFSPLGIVIISDKDKDEC